MAKADSTRTHRCTHCGSEFSGRKKKFCTIKCRDQHRKEAGRTHINGDRQFCSDCGEWWPQWLFGSGSSAAKCATCNRYKAYLREQDRKKRLAVPEPVWRVQYLHKRFNAQMKLGGHERCTTCSRIFPSKEMHKGQCKGCENRYRRTPDALAKKRRRSKAARRAFKAIKHDAHYDAWKQHRAFERLQSVMAQRNAAQALKWHIKSNAPDDWVHGWFLNTAKPWTNPRLNQYQQYKMRLEHDPEWARNEKIRLRLKCQMRKTRMCEKLQSYMRICLRKGRGASVFERRFGYTVNELAAHLEKQFTKGMTWSRFFQGDIHIDHIIPKSAFDLTRESDIKACWCLSNLRPLWAQDNIEKGADMVFLL
jgi:predicted  nucleic acid-binding Zn-ribbon protein